MFEALLNRIHDDAVARVREEFRRELDERVA